MVWRLIRGFPDVTGMTWRLILGFSGGGPRIPSTWQRFLHKIGPIRAKSLATPANPARAPPRQGSDTALPSAPATLHRDAHNGGDHNGSLPPERPHHRDHRPYNDHDLQHRHVEQKKLHNSEAHTPTSPVGSAPYLMDS